MFNSGLRVVASKYDDKLLSLESLLCIASSHVHTANKKTKQQPKNSAPGKYDVIERANIRRLYESVVYSVNLLCDMAAQMEVTVVFV